MEFLSNREVLAQSYMMEESSNYVWKLNVKKFYTKFNDEDTLRAVRIIKVIYPRMLYVEVAGIGFGYVDINQFSWYRSIDHYKRGENLGRDFFKTTEDAHFNPTDAARRSGIVSVEQDCERFNNTYIFYRWCWQGNKAEKRRVSYCITYDVATDEFSFEVNPLHLKELPYATKGDAYAANEVSVIDFDDCTDTKQYDMTIEVINEINVSVKADSVESALKFAKDSLGNTNYKVYLNGEIAYESK